MIPKDKKNKDNWVQILEKFNTVWVQVVATVGLILVAILTSPLWFEKIFPTIPTPTPEYTATFVGEMPSPANTPLPPFSNATLTPSNSVIPSLMWDVFSSDGQSFSPIPFENCANDGVGALGIFKSYCDLVFTKGNIRQRGVFGVSVPIQQDAVIEMLVTVSNLLEGEFWVALSDGVDPQSGSVIYAVIPDPGGVDIYLDDLSSRNARYPWTLIGQYANWSAGQPHPYKFSIQLSGNNVSVNVNSVTIAAITAPSTHRLFIGYRSMYEQTGAYIDVVVSGLTVTIKP